ncbi:MULTISPECIES: hypothetical protein [Pseudomonas]|uniref:hypothetical protein n=1 Tax=Pseudomonas TaxID=286 RepID=UPI0006425C7E|nr:MULTISPECIES: hypothetical protein [Pseudomonas]MBM1192685.1 hypothetical protein [Pseudomonas weihenstephanensis]QVQ78751.1 hypothetical protein KIN24_06795 [Pseudomonas lundensis]QVQ82186.1 hypothetical protein KIY13_02660 [Pseudomonas lundensis]
MTFIERLNHIAASPVTRGRLIALRHVWQAPRQRPPLKDSEGYGVNLMLLRQHLTATNPVLLKLVDLIIESDLSLDAVLMVPLSVPLVRTQPIIIDTLKLGRTFK